MEINLTLDTEKSKNRFTTLGDAITIRQGDGMSYHLNVDIRQAGEIFDLDGYVVRLYATKPSGDVVIDGEHVSIVDAKAGSLVYTIPAELISERGKITDCYFRITETEWESSEFSITTESFALNVIKGVMLKLLDGDYIPELDDLIGDLEATRNKFDDAEYTRSENEGTRIDNEAARVVAETDRLTAEAERREAELVRIANEEVRVTNEDERMEKERQRIAQFEEFEQRARGWARYVCEDGEYDPISGVPTVENPSAGTLYYVPITDPDGQTEGNRYEEWTYTDLGWERLGTADMFYSAIGQNEIDDVVAGEYKEGSAALTLTGLTHFWQWITSKFAKILHKHSTDDFEDAAITTPKLADGAVTTDKLQDGSVTTDKITDGAITTKKLEDGSITAVKIREPDQATLNHPGMISNYATNGFLMMATELLPDITESEPVFTLCPESDLKEWANEWVTTKEHTHKASDITEGTFGASRIANNAITDAKLSSNLQHKLEIVSYPNFTYDNLLEKNYNEETWFYPFYGGRVNNFASVKTLSCWRIGRIVYFSAQLVAGTKEIAAGNIELFMKIPNQIRPAMAIPLGSYGGIDIRPYVLNKNGVGSIRANLVERIPAGASIYIGGSWFTAQ